MKGKRLLVIVITVIACVCASIAVLTGCNTKNPLESVTIANKEALTAEWYEGGEDRTIELTFAPDSYTVSNTEFTVVSSEPEVVKAEGTTLKALAGGTAKITVTAGELTDSVDITVKPVLKGVTITNKTALTAAWTVGEADRTVAYTLSPADFTDENTEVSVTSNKSDVVKVEGKTLKALKEGTATITVTAGTFTDTVEISVRPQLAGISITNKTALQEEWLLGTADRTVEVALSPAEYYTAANTKIEVTASVEDKVEIDGLTLKAKNTGTVTITVKAGTFTDTVELTLVVENPTLELDGNAIDVYAGEEFELPEITALTCDGKPAKVEIDFDDDKIKAVEDEDDLYQAPVKGMYTITVKAIDERDTTKFVDKTITVNVWRNVFGAKAGKAMVIDIEVDGYKADAEQTAKVKYNSLVTAQFDATPAKVYYSEVTYTTTRTDNPYVVYGMSHSAIGAENQWLGFLLDSGNNEEQRNAKIKYFDMENDSDWATIGEWQSQTPLYYSYRLDNYRALAIGNSFPCTIATARIDDFFYFFVNGIYVNGASCKALQDQDTVPGIFGETLMNDITLTKMLWLTGDEATAKVNEITHNGADFITAYVPADWAKNSQNTENKNFTTHAATEADGINFDFTNNNAGWNDGLVSPYIYFDGDFEFEWTYENTGFNSGKGSTQWLDIRSHQYGDPCIEFGALWKDSTYWYANGKYTGAATESKGGQQFKNSTSKLTFKVKRVCNADGTATFTCTVIPVGAEMESWTQVHTISKDSWNKWDPCGPVLLSWHNNGVTGKYTNVKWSVVRTPEVTED